MARKLACLFYRLIKHGQQYVDKGTEILRSQVSRTANPIADEAGAEARFSISYPKDRLRVSGELSLSIQKDADKTSPVLHEYFDQTRLCRVMPESLSFATHVRRFDPLNHHAGGRLSFAAPA
jgi:hypothetical protein